VQCETFMSHTREVLAEAVGSRPISPPSPLACSPWVAMSIMQKAIRRGREQLALSAAATLLRDAPDKLWRRIGVIAFEDVGVANLDAVGLATVALAGKQVRATLGGEWAVTSCIVLELCRAAKCRSADDLLMIVERHPALEEARRK
jgi:replication-associated recombination protein RarA